jgi:dihydroorotate dehydrogenase
VQDPAAEMFYRFLLRPLLWLLAAETAHHFAFACLRFGAAMPGGRALLSLIYGYRSEVARTEAFGVSFPTPVGLAAGFDKDAQGYDALSALGFGFVEIGTVTGDGQSGNAKPRMFRLPKDGALINRMGFNNRGSEEAARRLSRGRRAVVGVNIGKTKVVPEHEAAADYVKSTERLARHSDYFVVNVSSPNTPGLRNLQAVDKLRPLLSAVRDALDEASPDRRVPLLVKIAPDLADPDVDEVADLALELGLDGIIATNTTISREGLRTPAARVEALGAGGLSGRPLNERSLAVLRRLRARVGDRVVLVAVGGIASVDDAWSRILAGATLVQVYTAFVYEGPNFPSQLARGLVARAEAAGFARVSDAVGTG